MLGRDRRNSMSSGRSGGTGWSRCMESYCRGTDDMPTGHDLPPLYGPLYGVMRQLCAHASVEGRGDPLISFVAKPIDTQMARDGRGSGSWNLC